MGTKSRDIGNGKKGEVLRKTQNVDKVEREWVTIMFRRVELSVTSNGDK